METATRIERLEQLRDELQSLLIRTERRTYGDSIKHLSDLIEDLRADLQRAPPGARHPIEAAQQQAQPAGSTDRPNHFLDRSGSMFKVLCAVQVLSLEA